MSKLRLLVLTSCTGEKQFHPDGSLTLVDFKNGQFFLEKTEKLKEYQCSAGELYTGSQHLHVMQGIKLLRESFGHDTVDLMILSAGYGLIDENKLIVPYEVTFNTLSAKELDNWAKSLGIRESFERIISDYDIIFILLGERYLRALSLPVRTDPEQTIIFLTAQTSLKYIPPLEAKVLSLCLSNDDAKRYRCGLVGLKGFLLERFAANLKSLPQYLEKIYKYPELFQSVIQQNPQPLQLNLPIEIISERSLQKTISTNHPAREKLKIPNLPAAPNIHFGVQYFIPDWDDLVDPHYDFLTDTFPKGRDPYYDQVYAHQIYEKPNYNGILVSRVVIEEKSKKRELIESLGIDRFLRFPEKNIMGDCGAFGYIQEEVPPYSTDDVLAFYNDLNFDYGVSADHLIVGPFAEPGIREQRYELTLNNAEEFLKKHRERGYQFTPIGAVQGWSPESYAEAAKELINMGYDYIGLGGLVRSKSEVIYDILKAVYPHLTAQTRVHLFGIARIDAMEAFHHLGITSIDSASPLRRAWLGADANYHTLSGKKYAAIRIPPVGSTGIRTKKVIEAGIASRDQLLSLEKRSLQALRDFDNNLLSLDDALEAVLAYDELLELPLKGEDIRQISQSGVHRLRQVKRRDRHEMKYRELLEDEPWKKCGCEICQSLGIDVVIFRNNNRNRRRGFHNTYIFNKQLQQLFIEN